MTDSDFFKINNIQAFKFETIMVPIGYIDHKKSSGVEYVSRYGMKVEVDFEHHSLKWLNYLPENFKVLIGDTFYSKSGLEFLHEYSRQSNDYYENLREQVEDNEVWIYIDED